MFYSKDILARKDTNLGLVWYAATVGPRSGLTKLSKKEVNRVDIIRTCRDISQPPEPLALRLSSNLMIGVVRVYRQQYNNYVTDVNTTWTRIKRDLVLAQAELLEMTNTISRLDTVTFDYDMDVEQELTRSFEMPPGWDLELVRNDRARETAAEFGWSLPSQQSIDDSPSDSASSSHGLLHFESEERRRKITLDEKGKMAATDFDGRLTFNFGDEDFGGDSSAFYVDSEGRLVEHMPENTLTITDNGLPDPFVPSEVAAPDQDNGNLKRKSTALDENGPEVYPDDHPFQHEQHVPFMAPDGNLYPLPFEAGHGEATVPQGEPSSTVSQLAGAGPRRKRLMIDIETTLSQEELMISHTDLEQGTGTRGLSRTDSGQRRNALEMKARIDHLLKHPLGIDTYTDKLDTFWTKAAAKPVTPLALPAWNQDEGGGGGADVSMDTSLDDSIQDVEQPRHSNEGILKSLPTLDDYPDPEMVRNRPSAVGHDHDGATPAGTGFGNSDSMAADGYGGTMPWSDMHDMPPPPPSSADSSGGGTVGYQEMPDFDTLFHPASDHGLHRNRRSRLLDIGGGVTPPWTRAHSRTPSGGSGSGSGSAHTNGGRGGGSGSGGQGKGAGLLTDWETAMMMGESGTGAAATTDIPAGMMLQHSAMLGETAKFLKYARTMVESAGVGPLDSFMFSDVVPVQQGRSVAAAAFYHVLTLATVGVVRPRQERPYQDILVAFVDGHSHNA